MNNNTKERLEYSAYYLNRDFFIHSFHATIADSQKLDELETFVVSIKCDRNTCSNLYIDVLKILESLGVEELKVSKSSSKEEKFFELIERDLVDVCCEFEYDFDNEEEPLEEKKMSQAQVDHYISQIRKIFLEITALEDEDFEDKNCEDEGFQ